MGGGCNQAIQCRILTIGMAGKLQLSLSKPNRVSVKEPQYRYFYNLLQSGSTQTVLNKVPFSISRDHNSTDIILTNASSPAQREGEARKFAALMG